MSKKIIILGISFLFSLLCVFALTNDNNVNINKDISYAVDINYPLLTQTINVNLTITNLTNTKYPAILKLKELQESFDSNVTKQNLMLEANKSISIPITINYNNNDINKMEYVLNFGNKTLTIPIFLEKEKMPVFEKQNSITAFFTLTESNSKIALIIFDILLFVISIVLFTMFIGRLGNYIVKK